MKNRKKRFRSRRDPELTEEGRFSGTLRRMARQNKLAVVSAAVTVTVSVSGICSEASPGMNASQRISPSTAAMTAVAAYI